MHMFKNLPKCPPLRHPQCMRVSAQSYSHPVYLDEIIVLSALIVRVLYSHDMSLHTHLDIFQANKSSAMISRYLPHLKKKALFCLHIWFFHSTIDLLIIWYIRLSSVLLFRDSMSLSVNLFDLIKYCTRIIIYIMVSWTHGDTLAAVMECFVKFSSNSSVMLLEKINFQKCTLAL